MKRLAVSIVAAVIFVSLAETSSAQFFYRRTVVAPPPPMVVANRGPMVVYQPTTAVYSRRRPILGGYSVRTRPAYRRTVVW